LPGRHCSIGQFRIWGIESIYGFPGDRINGLVGALDRAGAASKLVRVGADAGTVAP
jgi:thiamine pyrophosphate-dependent acetolactate synthase large subunit-like protein